MDWEQLKKDYSLEDFYNLLCKNKPHHKSKLYSKWNYLESIAYEVLLNENENFIECDKIIDEIVEFLKIQKKEVLSKYE